MGKVNGLKGSSKFFHHQLLPSFLSSISFITSESISAYLLITCNNNVINFSPIILKSSDFVLYVYLKFNDEMYNKKLLRLM